MDLKTKQPAEVLDYDLIGSDWLTDGDYIVGVTSVATPSGLTVQSSTIVNGGLDAKVWLASGTDGVTYKVTTTITTNGGRIKEKEFHLKVREL